MALGSLVAVAASPAQAQQPAPSAPKPSAQQPAQPAPPAEPPMQLPPAPPIPPTPPFLPSLEDPKENATTPEKVQLGYLLFFEKLISKDRSMSCESCHHPNLAWTEGQAVSPKVGGAPNKRNAPTVLNVAYHTSFYWDGRVPTLEGVCKAAWTGQLGADPASIATALNTNGMYRALFTRAFNSPATADNIPMALASFLRALKSGNSSYDKFEKGDKKAVGAEAKHGFEVFRKANCALCHVPPLYTDFQFHNAGIGWDLGEKRDHGRMDATKDPKDDGKFKTPTLRDIAKTGPYFHDGSAKTLDEAIDVMIGGGKKNPNLDEKLKPAKLSKKDKAALKAFLDSLTGVATFTSAPELPR
jgi:cytochrome c peroxidase